MPGGVWRAGTRLDGPFSGQRPAERERTEPTDRPMTLIPHTHEPAALPLSGPVFDAENIQLQRRMRFNPLRTLYPENLSLALDQFEMGILRQAALLWEAIARRDDTLAFVKGH